MATWTDLSGVFGTQEQLTSTQQQQLRDNLPAAFEKASGAPQLASNYIANAMVGSDSIHSTQVKIADGTSGQDTSTGQGVKENHIQNNAVTIRKIGGTALAIQLMMSER
jgi:hypothetical protein